MDVHRKTDRNFISSSFDFNIWDFAIADLIKGSLSVWWWVGGGGRKITATIEELILINTEIKRRLAHRFKDSYLRWIMWVRLGASHRKI